ncbi:MAG TPA: addiction module protein [Burkholderiaceae bacterium]|nr:addiction module protein [Burkholderiaceae bacterium]
MSGKSAEGLSGQVQELVDKARRLSAAERAQLVGEILESLDEPDPAVDSVIYRVKGDIVRILAVSHQHRRPGYWTKRLQRS